MADTLDVLSIDDARVAINIDTEDHDAEIARQVTAISRIIDRVCGPVVVRTVTGEIHNGGSPTIRLRRYPVTSVTTVNEARYGSVQAVSSLAFGGTGDGYYAPTFTSDPSLLSGELHRRRAGIPLEWWPGRDTVQVTYEAGRYATTAAVDARFAEAAAGVLRRLWKRESGTWAQTASFFDGGDIGGVGLGFFRSVQPVIEELLWDDVQTALVGFA